MRCPVFVLILLSLCPRIAQAQAEALPPATPPPEPSAEPPPERVETSGYHNGTFFVRDRTDTFRLYLQGRVHVDWLDSFGPGASAQPPGSGLATGFYIRRARLEIGGELFRQWQWQLSAEFSSATSIDNAAGTQEQPTCFRSTTAAMPICTNREGLVDNPTVKPIPTDVFVNYGPLPWVNLEVGQFFVPFTLENPIGDNTTPFLERSLAVRNIGVPLLRDVGAMLWGEQPGGGVLYKVALVDGDGPNRVNVDSRYDLAGRVVVRPFAKTMTSFTKWAHIGASARVGSRDPKAVGYDLPPLTTQGGYPFWKPTYIDSAGQLIHVLPSAVQWGLAGDVYLPVGKFEVTSEFIYAVDETREAIDGLQLSPFTERLGELKGFAWYGQVGYWIVGESSVIGYPNYGRPVHLDLSQPQRPWKSGLQALAKFEQMRLTYRSDSRGGVPDSRTPDGDIRVDAVALGLNYWLTRHLRVGANFTFYSFPDSAPVTRTSAAGPEQSSVQRAIAPGQLLARGVDDAARDSGHTLEELQVRVGIQF